MADIRNLTAVTTVTADALFYAGNDIGGTPADRKITYANLKAQLLTLANLQAALGNQVANRIFAGPATGVDAAPAFRALVAADIPDLSAVYAPIGHNHSGVYEPVNANIQAHIASIANPHGVTKSQVGLGSVENTALSTWAGSTAITTLGTIATGTVPAANVSGLAAIATSGSASDLGAGTVPLARLGGITTSQLSATAGITSAQLAGSIAYSKLSLTGAIVNADLAGSIALSKLSITGTPDGSKFLRDDGSWQSVSATFANPSATIGLTATNGVATTAMRSDAAPALSQAITPTWTGAHVWSGATGSFRRDAIGTTSTDGIILENTTAAAAGAQQYSPRLRLTGQGWKTNATAASQAVDWIVENQPVQGTANPSSVLSIANQINGGGYTRNLILDSAGVFGFNISSASSGYRAWAFDAPFGGQDVRFRRYSDNFSAAAASVWAVNATGMKIFTPISLDLTLDFSSDLYLRRAAAASLALGAADAASPVAQTLSVQNVVAGTSNTAGAAWTLQGSRGTGTGAGGRIAFQTAPAGTSGTSQNALVEAVAVEASGTFKLKTVTFANLPTAIANGEMIFVSDGAVTSGADNTLTGGGTGALAVRINGSWRAFNAQN